MPYFYLDEEDLQLEKEYSLSKEESHHCAHVFRLKVGNKIKITNGRAKKAEAVILDIQKNEVLLKILSLTVKNKTTLPKIQLIQPLLKNNRMDWLLEKVVEVGCNFIQPLLTERCLISLKNEKEKEEKRLRYHSICLSALKQSGQDYLPQLKSIISMEDYFKSISNPSSHQVSLLLSFQESACLSLNQIMENKSVEQINLLVGPEGGLSETEENLAIKQGFIPFSLGEMTLRAETASLAALILLNYFRAQKTQ